MEITIRVLKFTTTVIGTTDKSKVVKNLTFIRLKFSMHLNYTFAGLKGITKCIIRVYIIHVTYTF